MGYYANSLECDFTVPAANVPAALAAINASEEFAGQYKTLDDFVRDLTCFEENHEDADGFALGYHSEKYLTYTDEVMAALAPYAAEGSFVRFHGEDDCLFGFIVVEGKLRTESGRIQWALDG